MGVWNEQRVHERRHIDLILHEIEASPLTKHRHDTQCTLQALSCRLLQPKSIASKHLISSRLTAPNFDTHQVLTTLYLSPL